MIDRKAADHALNDRSASGSQGLEALAEGLGLRIAPATVGPKNLLSYILNDRGVIARIETRPDAGLRWLGHWIGGTNAGCGTTQEELLHDIAHQLDRATRPTPWRSLAWPAETIGESV